jgi:hypothetical protein
VGGAALILARRQVRLYLLPAFVFALLVGISLQALHWDRWIIPAFPVLAVLSAYALHEILEWCRMRWKVKNRAIRAVVPVVIVLVAILLPLGKAVSYTYKAIHPSTNLLARAWVVDNLPRGSRIVAEVYTAPKLKPSYEVLEPGITFTDDGPRAYSEEGYQYIMVSSGIYGRFYREPERYPNQIAFYDNLFHNYRLIHAVEPDAATAGPTIRIYALDGAAP